MLPANPRTEEAQGEISLLPAGEHCDATRVEISIGIADVGRRRGVRWLRCGRDGNGPVGEVHLTHSTGSENNKLVAMLRGGLRTSDTCCAQWHLSVA